MLPELQEFNVMKAQCSCHNCKSINCVSKNQLSQRCFCYDCTNPQTSNMQHKNRNKFNFWDDKAQVGRHVHIHTENKTLEDMNSSVLCKQTSHKASCVENINELSINFIDENIMQSRQKVSPSTAKLSAQIMNVIELDDAKSLCKPELSNDKLSFNELVKKIKDVYKACSCKICECIANKTIINNEICDCKPCDCEVCKSINERQKIQFLQRFPNFVSDSSTHIAQAKSKKLCKCVPCECFQCPEIKSEPCDCTPCQCIECKTYNRSKYQTLVVATVEHDKQAYSMCQCATCACMECGQNRTALPQTVTQHEMATELDRRPRCHCEYCLNEACTPDNNDSCKCEEPYKLMKKPVQNRNTDYDIRNATIAATQAKINNKGDTIAMFSTISHSYTDTHCNRKKCSNDSFDYVFCRNTIDDIIYNDSSDNERQFYENINHPITTKNYDANNVYSESATNAIIEKDAIDNPTSGSNVSAYSSLSCCKKSGSIPRDSRYTQNAQELVWINPKHVISSYKTWMPNTPAQECVNDIMNFSMDAREMYVLPEVTGKNSQIVSEDQNNYSSYVSKNPKKVLSATQTDLNGKWIQRKKNGRFIDYSNNDYDNNCNQNNNCNFAKPSNVLMKYDEDLNENYRRIQETLGDFSVQLANMLDKYENANREFKRSSRQFKATDKQSILINYNTLVSHPLGINRVCKPLKQSKSDSSVNNFKEAVNSYLPTKDENLDLAPISNRNDRKKIEFKDDTHVHRMQILNNSEFDRYYMAPNDNVYDILKGKDGALIEFNYPSSKHAQSFHHKNSSKDTSLEEDTQNVYSNDENTYTSANINVQKSNMMTRNFTKTSDLVLMRSDHNKTSKTKKIYSEYNATCRHVNQEVPQIGQTSYCKTLTPYLMSEELGTKKLFPKPKEHSERDRSKTELLLYPLEEDMKQTKQPRYGHSRQNIEYDNTNLSDTYVDKMISQTIDSSALAKIHSDVKNMCELPRYQLDTAVNGVDIQCYGVIDMQREMDGYIYDTGRQKHATMPTIWQRTTLDTINDMKATYMSTHTISEHSIVLQWRLPNDLKNVLGYELLVDGCMNQRIEDAACTKAMVSGLPNTNNIILTIRTITAVDFGRVPTATLVYRR